MPSVSKKQHNFMAMCKHNPKHAKGKCPSKDVAAEFVAADKASNQADALEYSRPRRK